MLNVDKVEGGYMIIHNRRGKKEKEFVKTWPMVEQAIKRLCAKEHADQVDKEMSA